MSKNPSTCAIMREGEERETKSALVTISYQIKVYNSSKGSSVLTVHPEKHSRVPVLRRERCVDLLKNSSRSERKQQINGKMCAMVNHSSCSDTFNSMQLV